MKQKIENLSITLSQTTKSLLARFCKKRGIKINHFLEEAVLEKLEDEMDAEIIESRLHEPLIVWKKVTFRKR